LLSLALHATGLEGQVTPTKGILPANLTVQLYTEGRFVETVHLNNDGSFRVREINPGSYEFRIVDPRGDALRTEYLTIGSHANQVELKVPGISSERPPSGTVSVRALTATLPRNVRKEMERADKALKKGDIAASITCLKRALEDCQDCPQVYNNLGTRYMRTGAVADAAKVFRRAVELDPDSVTTQANLAIALITLQDFGGAEGPAGKAYELDRTFLPARYALGLIAIKKRDCSKSAVDNLRAAAELYSRAHLAAATALVCRGERDQAVAELSAYLRKPNAEQRDQVERWRTEISAGLQ
jgi:tetratricopeptide (TPR) repeat protein